ncbi:EAL domain-containing protein [Thioalkalivibrio sp. ALJ16]|uniref:EAL domain-containing protein n=1 Tax=Thioalkalivibrio sp. ALJ16 TaxID=1158762 RepID=UPI00035E14B5|nr:EAL domain-containing protein [Thioalkalivibrio sp. ALJ16]
MNETIRTLFVTNNPNRAEEVISSIRTHGSAIRPEQVATSDALAAALEERRFDVIVLIEPDFGLSREHVDEALHASGRRTPLVILTERPEGERLEDYVAGAHAVVDHELHELAGILTVRAAEQFQLRQRMGRMDASLQESERRCQLLLDNSRDAIAYVHEGMHIYANASWRERFGIADPEDVEGLPLMDLIAPESRDELKALLRRFQNGEEGEQAHQAFQLQSFDGSPFEANLRLSTASVEGEACTQVLLDSTQEDPELAEKIDYLSQRDLVTGLYNRQHFTGMIETVQGQAAQTEKPFALITLAVDRFTDIRATVGMSASDLLLADIGKLIEDHFPEPAIAARLEAEHFGILVPDTRRNEVESRIHGLMEAVTGRVFELSNASTNCTLSIGVVIADETAVDTEELVSQADRALQEAVEAGGGAHRFFRPAEGEMTQGQLDQQWKLRIQDALDHDRLQLLYQPIVNLHGNDRPRYSVFVRLQDSEGHIHEPEAFLPSAERTDMAQPIDRWILKAALGVLAEQLKQDPGTQFFLKLTTGSLGDPSVVTWLHDDLHALRIPADNVVVELKEPTVVTHLKPAIHVGRGLQEMHGHLCIDDFGNGLNPFQLLQHLEADHIKLDPSYVKNLAESEENQQLIREHIETAHAKGKQVIVPYVEDASVLAVLYSLNANLVQGYFLQAPMPAPTFDFTST